MAPENRIEIKNGNSLDSLSGRGRREERILGLIKTSAEVMGSMLTPEAAVMLVYDLLEYPDDMIAAGLKRCRAEVKPIRGFTTFSLAILLEKMGVVVGEDRTKAEAAQAWEQIRQGFATCSDYCGCGFQHTQSRGFGDLPQRTAAALRMIGGRERIEGTHVQDIHFVQKAFLEAYERQEAIENLNALPPADSPVGKLLAGLVAKKS